MFHLTSESFAQYGSSSLYGYQFVKQEILYSLFLLHTFHYNQYVMWNVMNNIVLVLSTFRTKLLAANHLIIRERTKFDTKQKSLKLLLEIMTLIQSASNFGSDTEFILMGRSHVYIMNNRGPRIGPWGTPCFSVPS